MPCSGDMPWIFISILIILYQSHETTSNFTFIVFDAGFNQLLQDHRENGQYD